MKNPLRRPLRRKMKNDAKIETAVTRYEGPLRTMQKSTKTPVITGRNAVTNFRYEHDDHEGVYAHDHVCFVTRYTPI
jgi:hypothetical protein